MDSVIIIAIIGVTTLRMQHGYNLKNIFSNTFFIDFSGFWPPEIEQKSSFFRIFFENVNFVKIIVFLKENCYFSGFEPPENDPKSMPKRTQKKH